MDRRVVGTPAGATWHSAWVFLGNKSNQSKSKNAEMGTTCLLQQICKNKTKKNFTRARTQTIDNSVAIRQCAGGSTTIAIRLPRKRSISEVFKFLASILLL